MYNERPWLKAHFRSSRISPNVHLHPYLAPQGTRMPMPSLFRRNGAEDADLHSRARAEVGGRKWDGGYPRPDYLLQANIFIAH